MDGDTWLIVACGAIAFAVCLYTELVEPWIARRAWVQSIRRGFEVKELAMGNKRRGFSFAEVMFAVVILGVGFICIAAIFPVAIQQQKATSDEARAAAGGKEMFAKLEGLAESEAMPALVQPHTGGGFVAGQMIYGEVYSVRDPQPQNFKQLATYFKNLPPTHDRNPDRLWNKLSGELIGSTDPQYGCVLLYRRDRHVALVGPGGVIQQIEDSPFAQIYVVATAARVSSNYSPADMVLAANSPAGKTLPLQARPVKVMIVGRATPGNVEQVDLVAFDKASSPDATANANAAAEGAFLIIARDNITTPAADIGRLNGRGYRLGTRREDLDGSSIFAGVGSKLVFELQPGSEFSPDPGADGQFTGIVLGPPQHPAEDDNILAIGNASAIAPSREKCSGTADAFIVGRTPVAGAPVDQFDGPAQDVSMFTSFLSLK